MARLLVVDDESSIRISFREFLQDAGNQVEVASDADEAQRLLRADDFDVVVADIILPRISGVNLLRAIKQTSPHVVVILMTGEPSVETASAAVRAGAFDYLAKPIGKESLLEAVAKAVMVKSLDDERRRLLEQNRQYQENLERLVEQRTADLQASNRALGVRSECNQAIVHCTSEPSLLSEACRILVETGGYRLAWVGFAEQDEAKSVLPVAQSGYDKAYLNTLDITWANTERGRGPTGTAIRTCQPVACRHILTDPEFAPWRTDALDHGYRSSIALPLLADQRAFGAINVYSAAPDAFDREEKKLLLELAQDVAHGIVALRTRQQHKRAEEERKRLIHAIEQTAEVIVITDTDAAIQYVNPAFERITGYPRAEVIGCNPRILASGKHDAAFYREMWDQIGNGKTWEGHLINRKKGGDLFTEQASISPVVDASGATVNYVAVKRDITEYLRSEEERALLKEQYHRTQKVESIGRLAGGVAHDLNNLLSPILLSGELLLAELEPGEMQDLVSQIMHAGSLARDLVRQLLALGRRQVLEYKAVDINRAINGVRELLRRTTREDIEIEIILAADICPVMADFGQIEQVIMNLVVNASDAMPDGGHLTIATAATRLDEEYSAQHEGVKPGHYVMLAISDTGCGMHDETLSHLYEPFYSTKGEQGTGLGLATVHGIVKQHGGDIMVSSELGRGTTFKIYLPVFAAEKSPLAEKSVAKTATSREGSETILLVEDDELVRRLTQSILEGMGYRVFGVETGAEALAVMASHEDPVDLLFTDVVLPEMNGKELFAQASAEHPGLKVLFMSGHATDVIVKSGVLDEATAFIQKPFSIQGMTAKVREVLERD